MTTRDKLFAAAASMVTLGIRELELGRVTLEQLRDFAAALGCEVSAHDLHERGVTVHMLSCAHLDGMPVWASASAPLRDHAADLAAAMTFSDVAR